MFTAIRAETAHSPTYQLLRGEIKKRGGRSPGSGNQVIAGQLLSCIYKGRRRFLFGSDVYLADGH